MESFVVYPCSKTDKIINDEGGNLYFLRNFSSIEDETIYTQNDSLVLWNGENELAKKLDSTFREHSDGGLEYGKLYYAIVISKTGSISEAKIIGDIPDFAEQTFLGKVEDELYSIRELQRARLGTEYVQYELIIPIYLSIKDN